MDHEHMDHGDMDHGDGGMDDMCSMNVRIPFPLLAERHPS
jgi:hypothetical protein